MSDASVREVAVAAGVSVGTVSNVLNHPERVSESTRERVLAAIAELGFVRNEAARQLRAGRGSSIGLVVLDARNPFFAELGRSAGHAALDAGYTVLLADSDADQELERRHLELFRRQRVAGVLISPASDATDGLHALHEAGVAVVLVDRAAGGSGLSSVAVDDVAGGRLAVQHLLAGGARRIAVVGGSDLLHQVRDRIEGARRAAAEAGVDLEVLPGAMDVEAGRRWGRELLARPADRRPDAVFCVNDLLAVGVLQALVLAGVEVPDEMALIGYDDIDFAAAAMVPLTTIGQPEQAMGRTAVELLLEHLDGGPAREVLFTPELVVRSSTRAGSGS